MSHDYIKEKAFDKVYSKIQVLGFKIASLNKEVKNGGSGGISLEQLLGVIEHNEMERHIWSYILSLIEKDNRL
jgi:hypothetical protein